MDASVQIKIMGGKQIFKILVELFQCSKCRPTSIMDINSVLVLDPAFGFLGSSWAVLIFLYMLSSLFPRHKHQINICVEGRDLTQTHLKIIFPMEEQFQILEISDPVS